MIMVLMSIASRVCNWQLLKRENHSSFWYAFQARRQVILCR
jgi:hypothetical protein